MQPGRLLIIDTFILHKHAITVIINSIIIRWYTFTVQIFGYFIVFFPTSSNTFTIYRTICHCIHEDSMHNSAQQLKGIIGLLPRVRIFENWSQRKLACRIKHYSLSVQLSKKILRHCPSHSRSRTGRGGKEKTSLRKRQYRRSRQAFQYC